LQYSHSQVFTDLYEKELSAIISILHLYVPLSDMVRSGLNDTTNVITIQ
jgi:hypothetical protein